MNKTIYLRDDEGPVWERARELAGDKLSPVIVSALKEFVAMKEAEMAGFERIEVRFSDSHDHNLPKRKAFYGRWVFSPTAPFAENDDIGPVTHFAAVAVTRKGSAVFYTWVEDLEEDRRCAYTFDVFPGLEAAAAQSRHNHAAVAAIEKIGMPVEELDI